MLKIFEPAKGRNYDIGVILSAVFLTAVGVLMVYSTSSVYSMENFGDPNYYLKRHAAYLALGLLSMFAILCVDYRVLRKLVYPAYFIGLCLLILVLIIGKDIGGARRWIDLGAFSFQPSEIAKYIIVLYLAHSLTKKRDKVDSFVVGFASHILIAGVYVILILLEPDFGTATIMIAVLFTMMFIGEVRIRYLVPLGLVSVALLCVAVLTKGYRMERITAFMDPWQDPLGSGYQSIQSFIAFALGGIYGAGLGDSTQKLFFLPQAHTDFIFSIIGEELGFIGVVLVIIGFVILLVRSLRVSLRAPDLFGCYLVFGCVVLIALQAGMNMAVAVGLFPTKGLTLPFISYGGTSLITSLAAVGIILNVSRSGIK
ncbi:MAG: putative lipid II flippase FtsW [Thermodesulfobacteriota bacterium]